MHQDVFDQRKKDILSRADHSNKGSIDEPIRTLLGLINGKDDFYTTSSCSGRVRLVFEHASGKKCDTEQLFVSHEPLSEDDQQRVIALVEAHAAGEEEPQGTRDDSAAGTLWLKMEAFIVHIACRDQGAARRMLLALQAAGCKRAGIISLEQQPIIEAVGTERIEALAGTCTWTLEKNAVQALLDAANARMLANRTRIAKLEKAIAAL